MNKQCRNFRKTVKKLHKLSLVTSFKFVFQARKIIFLVDFIHPKRAKTCIQFVVIYVLQEHKSHI